MAEPGYGVDYLRVNDTYYSWLLTYIEAVEKTTGKKIDLFDNVSFGGDELESIESELTRALEDLKRSDTTLILDPVVQTNADGTQAEHPRRLRSSELKSFLTTFLEMAAQAKAEDKYLSFAGQ